jgi:hypothetical protein
MITFLINLCFSLPARFLISKPFFIFVVMPIYIHIYIFFTLTKQKLSLTLEEHTLLVISQILCGLSMNCLVWLRNLPLNVSSGTLLI